MNTADSEEMSQPLIDRGLRATADPDKADVIIMNTCTVREQAEHRAKSNLGRLAEWKEADPNRILIVAGCAASRWGTSIQKRYPFIDAVSPATQIAQFPELIASVLRERWDGVAETTTHFVEPVVPVDPVDPVGSPVPSNAVPDEPSPGSTGPTGSTGSTPFLFGDAHTAYVTIMRGCNYQCSYCIVPQVRGREVYRPIEEIVAEIRAKTSKDLPEVMLLGQTVNSYFHRSTDGVIHEFHDLLRAVNEIPTVERIRFMSPHPRHMRDKVIRAMAESPKVCRHLHLPMQSGSDKILTAMRRFYSRADYSAIVQKLRDAMPGILVTTDLIVGFPGETTEDFEQTLAILRDLRFDGLFAFKYSPRPGTSSAELPDDVSAQEKEDRLQAVLALNRQIVESKTSSTPSLSH